VVLLDRDHPGFRRAICIEAVACFTPAGALLVLGSLLVPVVEIERFAVDRWARVPLPTLGMFGLAWAGLFGFARVIRVLLGEDELRRGITLGALACGVLAMLLATISAREAGPWFLGLVVVAPLACTAHLVYLARRELFH
jgi:hypothetical protein